MDDLQTAVFTAGQKLNILTGYSDIESLKKAIEAQGTRSSQLDMLSSSLVLCNGPC